MPDPFKYFSRSLTSSAEDHYEITPDDSADLPFRPREIYVNGAGDAAIVMNGVEIVYTGLAVGDRLPLRPQRVKSTGTTATLVAWY